jgi:hypothetical protein
MLRQQVGIFMQQETGLTKLDWLKNYQHIGNGIDYILLEEVWIQVNQEWVEAVVYAPVISINKKFVRSQKEFLQKFKAINK